MANTDREEALRRIADFDEFRPGMLDLSDLDIDHIPRAIGFSSDLMNLSLAGTRIHDLSFLNDWGFVTQSSLSDFDISNTPVRDLSPIANQDRLLEVDLRGTKVNDLRPLLTLKYILGDPMNTPSRVMQFSNTPACQDPVIAAAAAIEDDEERVLALVTHLRTLPPWPEPLQPPPQPTGEPIAPKSDPILPVVWTDDGLDLQPALPVSDPVADIGLEDVREIVLLLSRKANQHDDLRRLTDRAQKLLADPDAAPDPVRLHLVYQALRRLYGGHETRQEKFDDETVSALDALQDCVPAVTLPSPEVQALLQRQRDDRAAPSAGIDRAREEAVLRAAINNNSPVAPTLRGVAEDVLNTSPDDDLGASRRWLSREILITGLKVAATGAVGVGSWILSQSPEIQSLAASIGDDAYWWATRIIEKLRAAAEIRAPGP